MARARVERSSDQLIPELKDLVGKGKLAYEAAWHLSQLTHGEQKVLLEMVKETGMTALDGTESRKIKLVMKKARDEQEWQQFQKELLALREEKKRLENELAKARQTIENYLDEFEELQSSMNNAAGEALQPEVVTRINFLEKEISKYTEEKMNLDAELQEVKEQMTELQEKFLEEKAKREEAEQKVQKLQDIINSAREIAEKAIKRGRKRKTIYQQQIDRMEERLERYKEKHSELKEEIERFRKINMVLARKVINLAARKEHMQTNNALRTILGILHEPAMKALPDQILLNEGDVLQTLDLFNEVLDTLDTLLNGVNKATRALFQKLEVVEVGNEARTQKARRTEAPGTAS